MANELILTQAEIKDKAIAYLDSLGMTKSLKPAQKDTFVEICQAYQLNPFKKEIWAVPYKDDFSIIVGYETYLKRAERTGKLNGWKVEYTGDVAHKQVQSNGYTKTVIDQERSTLCAILTIYRKDWEHPFVHEAYLSEFCGMSPIWVKSARFMLKKTVISQGFRLCFSDDLGGLPYTMEETDTFKPVMDAPAQQKEEPKQITDTPKTPSIELANALKTANRLMSEFSMLYSVKEGYDQNLKAAFQAGDIGTMEAIITVLEAKKKAAEDAMKAQRKPMPGKIAEAEIVPESEPKAEAEQPQEDTFELNKLRSDIVNGFNALAKLKVDRFDQPSRKAESMKKHLDVENLAECTDIPKLTAYLDHLRQVFLDKDKPKEKKTKAKDEKPDPKAEARKVIDALPEGYAKTQAEKCWKELLVQGSGWEFITETDWSSMKEADNEAENL